MSSDKKPDPRCAYRSPTGRRCRNTVSVGWNMCSAHCDFGDARAATEIVSNRDRLDTAEGIHSMMARVIRALAAGKIRSREAGMLIYGGQSMLQSLTNLKEERKKLFIAKDEDAWREKALADSYHDALNCEDSPGEREEEEEPEENQEAGNAGGSRK
ncbi:MAG: hypothetical protein HY012_08630 [Acidobacteria bacterium]|nr:hypothetical protein [Acidobacteriota bacterium]